MPPLSPRAKLTLGLLGIAAFSATALALGVGRPDRPENPGVVEIRKDALARNDPNPGRRLFSENKCVVCHGADGSGTEMGPGLGAVMGEYVAKGGSEKAAVDLLVEYLKDPKGRPKLRRDSSRYPNPMPAADKLLLTEDQTRAIAEWVIHLKPQPQAVGGDAQGR